MKTPVPITIRDLECTARDAKNGVAEYRGIKVYWDDATGEFCYYNDGHLIAKHQASFILEVKAK